MAKHVLDNNLPFLINVGIGDASGYSLVHKFGRNDSIPNGTWAFVNQLGFTSFPLSAPTTVRIKAGGDANDTVDGSGAQEITVQGINDTFNEVSETIDTAGASASSVTSASFWRVHRAWVSATGTYGSANTANIIVENSAGNADLILLTTDEGQSQMCIYTVPIGKQALFLGATATVDAAKAADVRIFTRENIDVTISPMSSKRIKEYWDGILGTHPHDGSPAFLIPAKTDIWAEARGGGAGTEVSVELALLLIDDS